MYRPPPPANRLHIFPNCTHQSPTPPYVFFFFFFNSSKNNVIVYKNKQVFFTLPQLAARPSPASLSDHITTVTRWWQFNSCDLKCQDHCRETSVHFKRTRTHTYTRCTRCQVIPRCSILPGSNCEATDQTRRELWVRGKRLHPTHLITFLAQCVLFWTRRPIYIFRPTKVSFLTASQDSTFGRQLRFGSFCQRKVGCEGPSVGPSNETTHCLMFGTSPHFIWIYCQSKGF